MSDELLRPFIDKLRGRPAPPRSAGSPAVPADDGIPPDSFLIREVRSGLFPEITPLHPGFVPGLPRVRITIDLGADLRADPPPLTDAAHRELLAFCPRLADHDCGDVGRLRRVVAAPRVPPPAKPAGDEDAGAPDGLAVAHLIEHVAIEILVEVSRLGRCSGVTCAHRDRLDRFDIFLESPDLPAGRAAAVLAAAVVRDLCLGRVSRLALHRRCRDLLGLLVSSRAASLVAEDAARRLACGTDEALQILEEVVRLGYLVAVPSRLLFSSATGVLFRRAPAAATAQPG